MVEEVRPEHYISSSIECIEAMEIAYGAENVVLFCIMNAFKYLWRHKYKNGAEDLKKAATYMNLADKYINDTVGDYELEQTKESLDLVLDRYLREEGCAK